MTTFCSEKSLKTDCHARKILVLSFAVANVGTALEQTEREKAFTFQITLPYRSNKLREQTRAKVRIIEVRDRRSPIHSALSMCLCARTYRRA
jgi:hypothetical protein